MNSQRGYTLSAEGGSAGLQKLGVSTSCRLFFANKRTVLATSEINMEPKKEGLTVERFVSSSEKMLLRFCCFHLPCEYLGGSITVYLEILSQTKIDANPA